jgi:eukaryotic-like serine/threonine-protein kinase
MEQSKPITPLLNNRYQLLNTLGSGGMAVVYRAHDIMLERPVAIKVLRQDFSEDEDFRERFRQEARAAANLSHPSIVTVHDFGFDAGRLFIVMEFVPGTDLKSMIKQRGKFSMEEAIGLLTQACEGIGYAHRAGLVHCDVKPHNMLVTPDNRLKVTDFGIARALASIQPDEQSDIVWGSPQYFAPEQAGGQAPSPASDVYSLGVILYEMLTGRLPFIANEAEELARMHRDVVPTSPRRYNNAIPIPLEQIVLKVLAKEPSQRYRSADQLGRVLRSIAQRPDSYATTAVSAQREQATQVYTPSRDGSQQVRSYPAQQTVPQQAMGPRMSDTQPSQPLPPAIPEPEDRSLDIDWGTILLGLLAAISVGGLIPFWLYIYLLMNPPGR